MVTTDDNEVAGGLYAFQQSCQLSSAAHATRCLLKLVVYHALTEPRMHVLGRAAYELAGVARFPARPEPQNSAANARRISLGG